MWKAGTDVKTSKWYAALMTKKGSTKREELNANACQTFIFTWKNSELFFCSCTIVIMLIYAMKSSWYTLTVLTWQFIGCKYVCMQSAFYHKIRKIVLLFLQISCWNVVLHFKIIISNQLWLFYPGVLCLRDDLQENARSFSHSPL